MNEKNAKITKRSHPYKGYASSYNIDILNSFNSELQPKDTESAVRNKLIDLLSDLRRFKYVTTLFIEFKKIKSYDATKYITIYSNSKAETIINESDINDVFESILNQNYIKHTRISQKTFRLDY